jgi:FixJ family two-component response regulator
MTEPIEPASGEGRRLLFIEDDEAVLKALGDYFAALKYEVIRAPTGKLGIAAFDAHDPDVTILDLKLPDIDGLEVLRTIRRSRAVVVMLTGYGDIPTAVRAMRLGAENFLTKPVDLPHLVAAVERAVEKRELDREISQLRRLVPTTKKRIQRWAAAVILVLGALWIGKIVGDLGNKPARVAPIAPTRLRSETAGAGRDIDSLIHPPREGPAPADSGRR